MIKHFISVEIVDHRLVSMPHLVTVSGRSSKADGFRASVEPVRGMVVAGLLSCLIWSALIAVVA